MKRKSLTVQREILKFIKSNPGITLSQLERKVRTNPRSLKEHCVQLDYLKLIKISKEEKTTKLCAIDFKV